MTTKKLSKTVIIISAFIMLFYIFRTKNTKQKNELYYLKSSNNIIILIENNKIIKKYSDVVLDNLPLSDQKKLEIGIQLNSIDEAERFIENYDG